MVLKKPNIKPKIEDLADWYAPNVGLKADDLIKAATKLASERGIDDTDALFLIVEESKRMQVTVMPLTEWKAQGRSSSELPSFTALCAVMYDKDGKLELRNIRAYPDTQDDIESVTSAAAGTIVKPDNVWPLKQKIGDVEIVDDSPARRGIFGVKRFGKCEDKSKMSSEEIASKIATEYKTMYGIVENAAVKFDKSLEKGKGSLSEKVAKAIYSFETAKVLILSDPRIPHKKADVPAEEQRRPRLECAGIIDVRGTMLMREFSLYYDTEDERLRARATMKIPVLANSQNFFELRARGEDGQSSTPMFDALGNVKLGIKGLRKEKEGDEVVEQFKEKYTNVLDMCDPSSDSYTAPIKLPEGQIVEFSDMGIAPFLIVNAPMSTFDDKRQLPILRVVLTDGKRKVDAALYGGVALDLVGADSNESFLSAVKAVDGACVKKVHMYVSRTWRANDKSDAKEPIFHYTVQGIHKYDEVSDKELNELYAHE